MPLLKDEEYVSNEQSDDDDYDCPAYHTRRKKSKKSQDKTSEADYEYDSDSSAHKKRRTIPRLTLNEALSKLEELDSTHRVFEHKDNMFSQQNADDKNNSSSSSPISEKNVNSAEAKNENSEETSSTTNTNNANNNSNNSKSIKNGNSKKKPNLPKSVKHFSSQDLKMLGWSDARIRAYIIIIYNNNNIEIDGIIKIKIQMHIIIDLMIQEFHKQQDHGLKKRKEHS